MNSNIPYLGDIVLYVDDNGISRAAIVSAVAERASVDHPSQIHVEQVYLLDLHVLVPHCIEYISGVPFTPYPTSQLEAHGHWCWRDGNL